MSTRERSFGREWRSRRSHVALGRQIRQLRVDRGLSQEGLGPRIGMHRTYVGHVERGEKNVSATNLFKLAVGLSVPARALFDTLDIDAEEALGVGPTDD